MGNKPYAWAVAVSSTSSSSSLQCKLGNRKWFSSTYWAPKRPFSAQKYRSVVCSLRFTSSNAGGTIPSEWMYLRAAVTGLSSPLSILYWGTCSRILRPSKRRRLLRLRLLANLLPPLSSGRCSHSYKYRNPGKYNWNNIKFQLPLMLRERFMCFFTRRWKLKRFNCKMRVVGAKA